ncbi:hypothetical protein CYMTET_19342, partial [Cymbomonas tetramitiformis]
VTQMGARKSRYLAKMDAVLSYSKYRRFPKELCIRLEHYYEVMLSQTESYNEQQILHEISPALRAHIMCFINKDVIEAVPFFEGCDDLFIAAILEKMTPVLYAPADVIIQIGHNEHALYVLSKGRAAIVNRHGKAIKLLPEKSYFGEISLFFEIRRAATIVAVSFCDVFMLMKDQLIEVLTKYPEMAAKVHEKAKAMFTDKNICFNCGQVGHISDTCEQANPPASNGRMVTDWDGEDIVELMIGRRPVRGHGTQVRADSAQEGEANYTLTNGSRSVGSVSNVEIPAG